MQWNCVWLSQKIGNRLVAFWKGSTNPGLRLEKMPYCGEIQEPNKGEGSSEDSDGW